MDIKEEALGLLRKALNDDKAIFHNGQLEAIEAVFTYNKSLVIQKTGWGKSSVYFISTKINRNRGRGLSIVISPLLTLIDNQIEAARKFGLTALSINWQNAESHDEIIQDLKDNKADLLFITPETLFGKMRSHLKDINIGMFIIDEVHCISDWGHDFRFEYSKIVGVLKELSDKSFPLLATTATANNRVIEDLKAQIGEDLYVSRGDLSRDNLDIQIIDLGDKVNRYGWILDKINNLPGTGIIYCLTIADCENLSKFLNQNGVNTLPFHSALEKSEEIEAINAFNNNSVKALVSTIKLGMGFDKPDVGFVIHFQIPQNIITYYQQIGRAARNIEKGLAIMLRGEKDLDILSYFIDSAFPSEEEMETVLSVFENQYKRNPDPVTEPYIQKEKNISYRAMKRALSFLEAEGYIVYSQPQYIRTPKKYIYNGNHYEEIRSLRRQEIQDLKNLFDNKVCISKAILNALGEEDAVDCGHCAVCKGQPLIEETVSPKALSIASTYLGTLLNDIVPKKTVMIPGTGFNIEEPDEVQRLHRLDPLKYPLKTKKDGTIYVRSPREYYTNLLGFALFKSSDELGSKVLNAKTSKNDYPELIFNTFISIVKPYIEKHKISVLTIVPSLNNKLLNAFGEKIAKELNIDYVECFDKLSNTSMEKMKNRNFQIANIENNYNLKKGLNLKGKSVLLLDDSVDTGFTLAYLGKELLINNVNSVLPIALVDTSKKEVYYE